MKEESGKYIFAFHIALLVLVYIIYAVSPPYTVFGSGEHYAKFGMACYLLGMTYGIVGVVMLKNVAAAGKFKSYLKPAFYFTIGGLLFLSETFGGT